jgi:hypothetical protein
LYSLVDVINSVNYLSQLGGLQLKWAAVLLYGCLARFTVALWRDSRSSRAPALRSRWASRLFS